MSPFKGFKLTFLPFQRVFQHVGCPHGCGDSRRDPSSDFIRSQGLLLMARLHRISSKFFRFYLRQIVTVRYSLAEVVDFLHALVGFCVDSGFVLSPMSEFLSRTARLAQLLSTNESSNSTELNRLIHISSLLERSKCSLVLI
jgi:hypothetical protein